jgi:phenylalanyl-tRNA synthetase beta chain
MAGAITGQLYAEHWNNENRDVDFYDVKGDVEALLAEATGQEFEFVTSENTALHPGQSATIISGSKVVGVFGALHPALEKKLGLDQQVFVFELDLALVMGKKLPAYSKLSPYPSIRRDLALLVDKSVSYAKITKSLNKLNIDALKSNFIFDVYEGEHVEADQKSLALGLIFQDFSRTLEEDEISGHVDNIITTLKEETGAVLR